MTYRSWKLPLLVATAPGVTLVAAESGDYFPPADKDAGWRTLTDAAKVRKLAGMDLSRLDQAFEFEKETSQHGGLDLVMYKMAASDAQLNPDLTGLPLTYKPDHSRDNWKPLAHDQFHDAPVGGDDSVRRLPEMVVAAVIP